MLMENVKTSEKNEVELHIFLILVIHLPIMIPRTLLPHIEHNLRLKPVVLITGARQTGKTTICEKISKEHGYGYVSLADHNERKLARDDPDMFLKVHPAPLIIDEVQYAKGLFEAIESVIDKRGFETGGNEGMYILTGSQAYKLMEGVSQSMAGRVSVMNMSPLSISEIAQREEIPFKADFQRNIERSMGLKMDVKDIYERIVRGSYPELYQKPGLKTSKFYSDYVDTYLTRDVAEIIDLKNKEKFLTFLGVAASLTGQELVYETLCKAVGVSKPTIESWLGLLRLGGIVHLLPSYSDRSMVKGAVKRPKLYFCDTGLACYLARIHDAESLRAGYLGGPMVETYIVNEIMKSYSNNTEDAGFYYYRDKNGNEIDLVMLRDGKLTLIECKAGTRYDSTDVKAFGKLEHSNYEIGLSCLICLTEKAYPLKDGVYALPITSI